MDDNDLNNIIVLTIFAGSVVAVIVGYVVAWRSKRSTLRKGGSLVVAATAGFAGLFMLMWMIGAVMPFPPPDGSSVWEPVIFFLVFSPLPLGAFYLSARFILRAHRGARSANRQNPESA